MPFHTPSTMCAAPLSAALVLAPGCGKGIFDRFIADTSDASAAEDPDRNPGNADVGPIVSPDVGTDLSTDADPNGTMTTEQTFDDTGVIPGCGKSYAHHDPAGGQLGIGWRIRERVPAHT